MKTGQWIGQIVSIDKQKEQLSGLGWGWRYKVRIISEDSNDDQISDEKLTNAIAIVSGSDGTGAAGRFKSLKYTQGDMVTGFYFQETPIIFGAFARGSAVKYTKTTAKFAPISGFTEKIKPTGPTERQESSEASLPATPLLKTTPKNDNKREPAAKKLEEQMGITGENTVNAKPSPPDRNSDLTTEQKLGPDSDALYIQKNGKTRYQESLERVGASPEEAAIKAAELRASLLADG